MMSRSNIQQKYLIEEILKAKKEIVVRSTLSKNDITMVFKL